MRWKKTRIPLAGRVPATALVEFHYGAMKMNESGGWKNDPRPIVLVFYDDKDKYIEGINTNYLSAQKLEELLQVVARYPIVGDSPADGKRLYKVVKAIEPEALVGYRRYKRDSIVSVWKYEVNLQEEFGG